MEQLTRRLDAKLLATDRVVAAARKDESGRALLAPLEHMAAHPVRGRNEPVLLWGIPRRIPVADANAEPQTAAG